MTKKTKAIVVVLFVLIAAGFLFFSFYSEEKEPEEALDRTLATVEGEKITQRDLNELIFGIDFKGSIEEPKDIEREREKEFLDQLIEWKIASIKAEEWGVEVSEEDFEEEARKRLGEERSERIEDLPEEQKRVTKKVIENEALIEKLKEEAVEWREGDLLLVRFDKYLSEEAPSGVQEWPSAEEAEQRAEEQREHADELTQEIYEELQEESITFNEATEIVREDPVVGVDAFEPLFVPFSQSFTREDWKKGAGLLQRRHLKESLKEAEKGLNEPFLASVEDHHRGEEREAYWVIANISKVNEGVSGSYEEWMEGLKDEMVDFIDEDYKGLYSSNNNFFQEVLAAPGGDYCGVDEDHLGIQTENGGNLAGLWVRTEYHDVSGNGPHTLDGVEVNVITKGTHNGDQKGIREIDITAHDEGPAFGTVYQDTYKERTFETGQTWYYAESVNDWGGNTCTTPGELIFGYGTHISYGIQWGLSCSYKDFKIEVEDPSGRRGEWDEDSKEITLIDGISGNGYNNYLTYTWREEPDTHMVTFRDCDGNSIHSEEVDHGEDATPPSDPDHDEYDFLGWDGDYTNVTGSRTIDADCELKTYDVTVEVSGDGSTSPEEGDHGVDHGDDFSVEADSGEGSYFYGWSGDCSGDSCELENITGDKEVTATFYQEPSISNLSIELPDDYCDTSDAYAEISWDYEGYGRGYGGSVLEYNGEETEIGVDPDDYPLTGLDYDTDYTITVTSKNNDGEESNQLSDSFSTLIEPPNPSFTWDPENPFAEEETEFLSQEEGVSWNWSFPDAEPSTSSDQDPVVVFDSEGEKQVELEVTREGMTCGDTQIINVRPPLPEWEEGDPF